MNTLTLPLYFVAGIACGMVYFRFLWWDVLRFTAAGNPAVTILLMLVRVALLGGVLVLASRQGALPLLLLSLGVFVARFVVSRFVVARGVRTAAP